MATDSAALDRRTDYENVDMDALDGDERRSVRARTENMVVVPHTDGEGVCVGMYEVRSESGSQYTVDLDRERGCTCPDAQYNAEGERCKHRKRVAMTVTETDCPAPGQHIGDYEATLADVRRSLERERAKILGDLETVNDLLEPLGDDE